MPNSGEKRQSVAIERPCFRGIVIFLFDQSPQVMSLHSLSSLYALSSILHTEALVQFEMKGMLYLKGKGGKMD
jgi:hypothetical protein